jgi:hypothetical protein
MVSTMPLGDSEKAVEDEFALGPCMQALTPMQRIWQWHLRPWTRRRVGRGRLDIPTWGAGEGDGARTDPQSGG